MRVFIDESGSFVHPASGLSVSCVSALAVAESALERVEREYARMLEDWGVHGELKGRSLTERRADRLITMLGNNNVVLAIVATDMGLQNEGSITAHKNGQTERLRAGVAGAQYSQEIRDYVNGLADRTEALPNQLYVESVLLTIAVERTLQRATLQFAQTDPKALGAFAWRVDAKDKQLTEYERLWTDLVMPAVQTGSLKNPLFSVLGGPFDYSAMAPFENPSTPEAPEHLRAGRPPGRDGPFESIDLKKVLADLSFGDSAADPGLQLADVLANVFRRACHTRMRDRGWRRLGQLMVRDHRPGHLAVDCVLLGRKKIPLRKLPYWEVLYSIEEEARPWMVDMPRRPPRVPRARL